MSQPPISWFQAVGSFRYVRWTSGDCSATTRLTP